MGDPNQKRIQSQAKVLPSRSRVDSQCLEKMERHLGLVQVRKMSGKEGQKLGCKQSILGCLKVGGRGLRGGPLSDWSGFMWGERGPASPAG